MKNTIFTLAFLITSINAWTQERYVAPDKDFFKEVILKDKKVTISQPAALTELFNKNIAVKAKNKTIPGWRIRIYSDLGTHAPDASLDAKAGILRMFPDISVYRVYTAPYFKVYVGDFRNKNEAVKVVKAIQREFPSAFLVRANINLPIID